MPRTRIKICGLKTYDDAMAAVDAGADALGFVFVRKSPRFIAPDDAKRIIRRLPAMVTPIGLFSDHPIEDVLDAIKATGLQCVQLHGREGPGFAKQLTHVQVIKAVSFEHGHVAERLQPWREARTSLAALLFDTPPPTVEHELTGGTGVAFDWEALARLDVEGTFHDLPPRILAGGLTADNVAHAIHTVRPYSVDVSSGVESSRGVKDPAMIAAFCDAVRAADAALLDD